MQRKGAHGRGGVWLRRRRAQPDNASARYLGLGCAVAAPGTVGEAAHTRKSRASSLLLAAAGALRAGGRLHAAVRVGPALMRVGWWGDVECRMLTCLAMESTREGGAALALYMAAFSNRQHCASLQTARLHVGGQGYMHWWWGAGSRLPWYAHCTYGPLFVCH